MWFTVDSLKLAKVWNRWVRARNTLHTFLSNQVQQCDICRFVRVCVLQRSLVPWKA